MTPIVGISCIIAEAWWGSRSQRAALLPATYVEEIRRAGGIPALLPEAVPANVADSAASAVERLDGLVLAGGGDADPGRYGADQHPATRVESQEREAWEFALLGAALRSGLPLLGICRGAQLLNVARGGDLVQHLPDVLGNDGHLPGTATYGTQRVKIDVTSKIGRVLGDGVDARCHHHQGYGTLGSGVHPVAWAEDGIVEGIELDDFAFAVGTQWHPERSGHAALFHSFIRAAAGTGSS